MGPVSGDAVYAHPGGPGAPAGQKGVARSAAAGSEADLRRGGCAHDDPWIPIGRQEDRRYRRRPEHPGSGQAREGERGRPLACAGAAPRVSRPLDRPARPGGGRHGRGALSGRRAALTLSKAEQVQPKLNHGQALDARSPQPGGAPHGSQRRHAPDAARLFLALASATALAGARGSR